MREVLRSVRTLAIRISTSSNFQPNTLVSGARVKPSRPSSIWSCIAAPIFFYTPPTSIVSTRGNNVNITSYKPRRTILGSFAQGPTGTRNRWWLTFTNPAWLTHSSRYFPGDASRPTLSQASRMSRSHLRRSLSSLRVPSSENNSKSQSWNSIQPPGFVCLKRLC